ncbi:6-phosphofructokinase [candidate division LCP-89 bacterium B3_LCP]|uniref:ATP-dependent 6-phosphofructokinase n=1 Tax=candidate division LCP-89 bacterium B3_LCP TaxID=2012998 RepID=A0A532UTZ1_UNCL8|nr:MAG: 6-phosphofructokinase [candidate division LCP-89 bacterium B3_LCP]
MLHNIAILTGGGDAPGLNSVIRAAVKTAKLQYGAHVLGIQDGYEGLVQKADPWRLDMPDVAGLLYRGGTILGTSNRGDPFHYPVERDGKIVKEDKSKELMECLNDLRVDALIVIGGDGSLYIANELHKMGAPVVGVPKTIDNDLSATEVTFGFDTAITTATEALDKLHTTAESHHRAMVLEVMGRDAGWIALESGIAGGADVILIPEIPFSWDRIYDKIDGRRKVGRKFSIVVAAEGAHPSGGDRIVVESADQTHGLDRLGGIGQQVGYEISQNLGMDTRVTTLGHIQRGGKPSTFDRILATRFGVEAVHMVVKKKFGHMVALRKAKIVYVPLEEAIGKQKFVDPDGQMVQTAEAIGISMGR